MSIDKYLVMQFINELHECDEVKNLGVSGNITQFVFYKNGSVLCYHSISNDILSDVREQITKTDDNFFRELNKKNVLFELE